MGTFWWVAELVPVSKPFHSQEKHSGSGCFSVARDMVLSSLILLSDKILSFGVKNIHVIICSNLSFRDHISYVASCIPSSGPPWAVRLLPFSGRHWLTHQGGLLPLHTALSPWKPSNRTSTFTNWFALPWPEYNSNSNFFSCRPSTKFPLFLSFPSFLSNSCSSILFVYSLIFW